MRSNGTARKEEGHAQVRDREGHSRSGESDGAGAAGDLPEVLRGVARDGAADPVGPELRDGRPDLLRVHRAERGDRPQARPEGRLSCEPNLTDTDGDRPDDV